MHSAKCIVLAGRGAWLMVRISAPLFVVLCCFAAVGAGVFEGSRKPNWNGICLMGCVIDVALLNSPR